MGIGSDIREVFGAGFPAIDSAPFTAVVKFPLLELALAFSNSIFAEKYPSRNLTPVPAIVLLTSDVREKFLVVDRVVCLIDSRKHDRHTILNVLDRKALAGEYRMIIACRWCCVGIWDHFLEVYS